MWGSVLGVSSSCVLGSHLARRDPCVRAPHLNTLPPFLSSHLFPSHQHTSPLTPYTFPHFSTPHTSFLTHPHTPTHFPTPPSTPPIPLPTAPIISPYTPPQHTSPLSHRPTHLLPQFGLRYVAKLPCDDVTLVNLTGLWKSLMKFFMITRNLKSCFGVGNVNFR